MIENGVGGTNTIAYAPSTVYDNTGALNDEQADLPFVTWVVQAMRFSDGLCTPSASANVFTAGPAPNLNHCIDEGHDRVTKLIYEDGRFDSDEREFRGFRRVVRRSVEGYQQIDNDTETTFGQDTATRGRVLTVQTFAGPASEQRQVRLELNMWGARSAGPGRTQVWRALHQVRTVDVDAATHLVTQEVTVAVDAYGNVPHSYKSGVEAGTDLVDTYTTFATPQSGYFIFDRPANVRVYDQSQSRLLEEKWFFYDGLGSGVTKGNVDTVRSRLLAGSGAVVEIHNDHDSYGNIWRTWDGNQNPTTTTFDALFVTV